MSTSSQENLLQHDALLADETSGYDILDTSQSTIIQAAPKVAAKPLKDAPKVPAKLLKDAPKWEDTNIDALVKAPNRAAADGQVEAQKRPRTTLKDKGKEVARMALTRARVYMEDHKDRGRGKPTKPISNIAKRTHQKIEPVWFQFGKNERVFLSRALPEATVENAKGKAAEVINVSSRNWAGLYELDNKSKELHELALRSLPIADGDPKRSVPALKNAAEKALAKYLEVDFAKVTSTDFGAAYLGLPALIHDGTIVLVDQMCSEAVFTGIYVSTAGYVHIFPHNDMKDLESALRKSQTQNKYRRTLVVVDGLYGNEGDVPRMADLYRLKAKYGFILFCDESNSFLTIGKHGMGCVEYWNDQYQDAKVPWNAVDMRLGSFAGSIGCQGGFIAGHVSLEDSVVDKLNITATCEGLSVATIIQLLWLLGQPTLIERRLHRVTTMARFFRSELARFGIHVYGGHEIPIIPIFAPRSSVAGKLSYVLRRRQVLSVPVVDEPTSAWKGRVILNLSAKHTDQEVNSLVGHVVEAARELGLCKAKGAVERRAFAYGAYPDTRDEEAAEARAAKKAVYAAGRADESAMAKKPRHLAEDRDLSVLTKAQDALELYGLGAGGTRWICGTFPPHLRAEAIACKITGAEACLTYADASIGLTSTILALCRPARDTKSHTLVIPAVGVPVAVEEAAHIAAREQGAEFAFARYGRPGDIPDYVRARTTTRPWQRSERRTLTIFYEAPTQVGIRDLEYCLGGVAETASPKDAVVVVVWCAGRVPGAADLDGLRGRANVQVVLVGSFWSAFGLPGGWAAGPAALVHELRHTSRAYMHEAAPQPHVAEMVRAYLAHAAQSAGHSDVEV